MKSHIHDVVVVGAGIAGLTAAHELARAGIRDVLILEAQDYIGGRIKTSVDWGDPVELGAEFVHGSRIATWEYINKIDLPTVTVGGAPKLIDKAGHLLSVRERRQYLELLQLVVANGHPGISVAEISRAFRGDAPQKVVDLVNETIGDYEAGDAEHLDSGAYTQAAQQTKHLGSNHALPHGYRQLIDYLASRQQIHTSTVVERVDLHDPRQIELTLQGGERMFAKHAIITVSLGVLKSGMIVFRPELPLTKQQAIRRLGMGKVLKYLLHFRTAELVHELFHMADGMNESLQTISCWWQSASNHKVLVGYAGGTRHQKIVAMNDDALLNAVLYDLNRIAGRDIRTQLTGHKLVRWDRNPFVRGGYSNCPVGVGNAEREVLAETVNERLFFAGEATCTSGSYATVHGAIESGQRVASQIRQAYHKRR